MNEYVATILFFLPAGVGNMSPVLANHIPLLNQWKTPIDFGKKRNNIQFLGENKTWRGILFGTVMAILTALLLQSLFPNQNLFNQKVISFSPTGDALLVGGLLGAGALFGDVVESFFKRWRGINSGDSWFPFDQLDYVVGGLFLVYPIVHLSVAHILLLFVVYFSLHLVVAYLAYKLGLKSKPM